MLLTGNLTRRSRSAPPSKHAFFRWLTALLAVSAAVLLPWTGYLAATLPPTISAQHWPLAWSGLDGAVAAGLAATAWLAIRRDRRAALVAVSAATLLLADAWFDVITSPAGRSLAWAVADMALEVAEAAACLIVATAIWRGPGPARVRDHGPTGVNR